MGKCSGMLLLSDYDNTFCYTEKARPVATAKRPPSAIQ